MSVASSAWKRCSVRLYLQLFVGAQSNEVSKIKEKNKKNLENQNVSKFFLFFSLIFETWSDCGGRVHVLFTHSGVQHILYCVFVLFFFVLCTRFASFSGLSFLIAPSVFSNVYFICYIWHHLTSAVNVSMSWYIYNIGVLTVNIEFMWRGLETGERTSFSESFHSFRAEHCIYPAIKFAKKMLFNLIIIIKR